MVLNDNSVDVLKAKPVKQFHFPGGSKGRDPRIQDLLLGQSLQNLRIALFLRDTPAHSERITEGYNGRIIQRLLIVSQPQAIDLIGNVEFPVCKRAFSRLKSIKEVRVIFGTAGYLNNVSVL